MHQLVHKVISIHTPTRGATYHHYTHFLLLLFQSTLPRGERRPYFSFTFFFVNFNPHSHEGSDSIPTSTNIGIIYFNPHSHEGSDNFNHQYSSNLIISIHTPTRGATVPRMDYIISMTLFQSTLPRGERQENHIADYLLYIYFNPHSHEGSDRSKDGLYNQHDVISIHTPTRGATCNIQIMYSSSRFQSTLPRGERLC